MTVRMFDTRQKEKICREYKSGMTAPKLAKKYSHSSSTIYRVLQERGERTDQWRGVISKEARKKIAEVLRGRVFTPEHRRKIGEALRGRKLSLEHRKAISNGLKKSDKVLRGNDNPAKKPEVRKKISDAHKGKVLSAETRKKMSEAHKGEKKPWLSKLMKERMKGENNPAKRPEVREKISIAQRGEKNHFYGKKRPEHSKLMMGKNNPFYGEGFRESGKNNPFYGKRHTEEAKKQMSETRKAFHRKNPRKHPNWILSHEERHGKGGVSKPQRKLFNLLSKFFNVELEYPIRTFESTRYADIALLSLRIDIEYDGGYWHDETKQEDLRRDRELFDVGWFVIRIDEKGKLTFGGDAC